MKETGPDVCVPVLLLIGMAWIVWYFTMCTPYMVGPHEVSIRILDIVKESIFK